jgi:DNA-nicking Smr family endonuclease
MFAGPWLDFHGLHAEEATRKFDELVKPVLPGIQNVTIITGRGLHSAGGVPVLLGKATAHAQALGFDCAKVEGNDGAVRVSVRQRDVGAEA